VLDRATEEARTWERAGKPLPVAVNVSQRSLHDTRLIDDVLESLHAHDVSPDRLQVEVTESAVMQDTDRAADVLRGLTGHGVSVSIDDFGMGYTSLNLLRRLLVSELKIDKSFVMGMGAEDAAEEIRDPTNGEQDTAAHRAAGDTAIVRSAAELAHNLGLTVVAEGVEDQWTLDLLGSFGCDLAQGYHIARPMASSSFLDWLANSSWRMPES
jgi:EAL domain-containing protein (putative c-di-GMP-specific phosphodiesterase class I)